MTDTITIKGLDKLTKKIKNIEGLKPVIAALRAGATHIKGKIAKYPPATSANSPSQRRWYERGYGPAGAGLTAHWAGARPPKR